MKKRGPYKRYNKNPSIPLPKTTAWKARNEIVQQILKDNIQLSSEEGMCIVLINCMCISIIISLNSDIDLLVESCPNPKYRRLDSPINDQSSSKSLLLPPSNSLPSSPSNSLPSSPSNSLLLSPSNSLPLSPSNSLQLLSEPLSPSNYSPLNSLPSSPSNSLPSSPPNSLPSSPSNSLPSSPPNSLPSSPSNSLPSSPSNSLPSSPPNSLPSSSPNSLPLSPSNLFSSLNQTEHFFQQPLYPGASLTTDDSWHAIMQFSVENTLPYRCIEKLLDLLRIHCPAPNNLPSSFYKLKKHYDNQYHSFTRKQFCSLCNSEVPLGEHCSRRQCRQMKAELCQNYTLNFDDSLRQICEGMSEIYVCVQRILFYCCFDFICSSLGEAAISIQQNQSQQLH